MEKRQKWSNNYFQTTCTFTYHKKAYAKFQNDQYKTVRGVALTRGTHGLYIEGEKWLSSQCGKSDKNDLTIISKPHAHPHTMKKAYAKFQNDQYKTVRGVALTRGTHCPYIEGEKWLSSQYGKSDRNIQTIIPKPHAHPHTMNKAYAEFQNDQYETVRVALTRGAHCLYIEGEKWLSSQCGKTDKKCSNNYIQTTCTSTYHKKTHAKFQNNQYKTVRGVALTRGTHCLYIDRRPLEPLVFPIVPVVVHPLVPLSTL